VEEQQAGIQPDASDGAENFAEAPEAPSTERSDRAVADSVDAEASESALPEIASEAQTEEDAETGEEEENQEEENQEEENQQEEQEEVAQQDEATLTDKTADASEDALDGSEAEGLLPTDVDLDHEQFAGKDIYPEMFRPVETTDYDAMDQAIEDAFGATYERSREILENGGDLLTKAASDADEPVDFAAEPLPVTAFDDDRLRDFDPRTLEEEGSVRVDLEGLGAI